MWKQVAPLFVIAVLIGWFMPTDQPPPEPIVAPPPAPPPDVAQPSRPAPMTGVVRPDLAAGEVVLYREGDGHFYAQGVGNSASLRFLVDTGASVVALTDDDAQRLGLYWHPGELATIGRGASGEVIGKQVMIDRLAVGDLVAQNVQAVIIPDGLDVSLLGQSFLSRVGSVSISGNQMTLKN
jgi:aspartyl protease family protein